MFRSSPLEELEERLSRLTAARDEKAHLAIRLRKAGAQRAELQAAIAAARKQVAREARDVERFEAGGLIAQIYEALNLADGKLEKERRELLAATLRLEEAENELVLLDQDTAALQARLDQLADVDESYEKALAEKQKWLAAASAPGAMPRVAEALERAERAGRLREWLREIDEAIDFGHRADETLRRLIETLAPSESLRNRGLSRSVDERFDDVLELEILSRRAAARSRAGIDGKEDTRFSLWSLARHRIILFFAEMRDVHDRIARSARTLTPVSLEQLLEPLEGFHASPVDRAMQNVSGLRAKLRTLLSQLQALRDELTSPGVTAGDVLRNLDRVHDE